MLCSNHSRYFFTKKMKHFHSQCLSVLNFSILSSHCLTIFIISLYAYNRLTEFLMFQHKVLKIKKQTWFPKLIIKISFHDFNLHLPNKDYLYSKGGFPGGTSSKESACKCRRYNVSSVPRSGRPPGGHDNPFWYSCLENPMDRGAWQATIHRTAKSQTWLSDLECMHSCMVPAPRNLYYNWEKENECCWVMERMLLLLIGGCRRRSSW